MQFVYLCNYAIWQLLLFYNYAIMIRDKDAIMRLCNYVIMQSCNYAIMQLCNYHIVDQLVKMESNAVILQSITI